VVDWFYDGLIMEIRPARPDDVPAIAKVHVDSWRTTYRDVLPKSYLNDLSYDARETMWQGAFGEESTTFLMVAEDRGKIAGFAAGGAARQDTLEAKPYSGELYAVYMLSGYQRRGLGRRLVSAVAEELIARGHHDMITWVLQDNAACRFYERLGGALLGSKTVEIADMSLRAVAYGWPDASTLLKPEV
jgi:ribosomal protein S18 acetylase RimI-like enzyme